LNYRHKYKSNDSHSENYFRHALRASDIYNIIHVTTAVKGAVATLEESHYCNPRFLTSYRINLTKLPAQIMPLKLAQQKINWLHHPKFSILLLASVQASHFAQCKNALS
jgi:hypothetical protein